MSLPTAGNYPITAKQLPDYHEAKTTLPRNGNRSFGAW